MKDSKLFLAFAILLLVSVAAYGEHQVSEVQVNGKSLQQLISTDFKHIIVSIWFKNSRYNEELNKKNSIAVATIRNLLSKCHPNTLYAKADLSYSNPERYDFERLAQNWNLRIEELDEGPMVMVMYHQNGEIHWALSGTPLINLIKKVHKDIEEEESKSFGMTPQECMVELDYSAAENPKPRNPYRPSSRSPRTESQGASNEASTNSPSPNQPSEPTSTSKPQPTQSSPPSNPEPTSTPPQSDQKFSLSEPEKAFSWRR
eukprot:CAMPEP_0196994450 /NCGR_PEP_ID=MMETSP1380-20130617/744_1 /TAXON_ID=5936 /ORGANISM="Euplotes crassus, Strain CT5" /LENGTH=258 /DNA_ID=CAMNT_0042409825 /DNA_START=12 /DNA_END=788 /DNA_ORIENTATION=+